MTRSHNRRHDVPRLYKYVSPEAGRVILVSRSLRWSSPELFNDPFDVRRDFELPFTNEELLDALIDRWRAYLRGEAEPTSPSARKLLFGLKRASATSSSEALLTDLRRTLGMTLKPIDDAREQFRAHWDERVPGMRILCFSADPTSPPMWAHYAANLTGMVLGFESSDERDSPWLLAQPVQYSEKLPSLPSADEWARAFLGERQIEWESYLAEYYFVKSPHWSYEKEYRVPSDRRAGETGRFSDYMFAKEDLREIVLGPRSTPELAMLAEVAVEMAYPNAKVRRAREDPASRRIVIEDRDSAT